MPLEWAKCAVQECDKQGTTRVSVGPDPKHTIAWLCEDHADDMKLWNQEDD